MSTHKPTSSPPLCITLKEAQRLSGLSHRSLYEAMNGQLLQSKKVCGRRLIVYSSFEKFLLERADDKPPNAFANAPRRDGVVMSETAEGAVAARKIYPRKLREPAPAPDPNLPSEKLKRATAEKWKAGKPSNPALAAAPAPAEPKRRGRPRKAAADANLTEAL